MNLRRELPTLTSGLARLEEAGARIAALARAAVSAASPALTAAEIRTAGLEGALVPHGDVMLVLDALLDAGLADVAFRGTGGPVPPGR